jgi:hypothetical protein
MCYQRDQQKLHAASRFSNGWRPICSEGASTAVSVVVVMPALLHLSSPQHPDAGQTSRRTEWLPASFPNFAEPLF